MKRKLLHLLPLLACMLACDLEGGEGRLQVLEDNDLPHDEIVLGDKLDDPYSLDNMRAAVKSLYPTKADRIELKPTHLYVRFLPRDEDQLRTLEGLGLDLLDHPMDYEILREGDYYHDPTIDDEKITWQYAVVPADFSFPNGIVSEKVDECYITENDPISRAEDGIDWESVEQEAYRLTGNEGMLDNAGTKGENLNPSGRITIIDDMANGGEPFGVAGVKVSCNAFVKFSSTYTDRDGYYQIPKSYSSRLRYRLVFKNEKNFAIGLNMILFPASTSTLGQAGPEGISAIVSRNSDRKLFSRCVVNNTAYEWYTRCENGDMSITPPPSGLRFWLFQNLGPSASCMFKHGAFVDNSMLGKYLGEYAPLLKIFLPDVIMGLKGRDAYSDIYAETCHALAHASHFSKAGKDYWDPYLKCIFKSFVLNGFKLYGDGTQEDSGYCEVSEMWAYYMENATWNDRYGGSMPNFGNNYWFHPQIFRYLDERGLGRGEIFKALSSDVSDKYKLQAKLMELYPGYSEIIKQVFERY